MALNGIDVASYQADMNVGTAAGILTDTNKPKGDNNEEQK
jgi:hypothetical protein